MNWRTWSVRKAGRISLAFVVVSLSLRWLVNTWTDSPRISAVVSFSFAAVGFFLIGIWFAAMLRAQREAEVK